MIRAAALAALLAPATALATAGYFQLGYGLKAKGMGGAAIAFPQDALAAATNPAGMVWIGDRLDAGVERFVADRGSEIVGNTLGLSGSRDANGRRAFLVPELGFSRMLDARSSIGVTVTGNGGSTRYRENPFAALAGSAPAGMELTQISIAPAFALKLGERQSVGVALNLVTQRLTVRGLEYFDIPAFTSGPGELTNRGRDRAGGVGVRVGWLGKVTHRLALGAAWQPKIRMGKFGRYKGLLADQGSFDIPESYGFGAALSVTPALTVAADVQRIGFAGVAALGNPADCFLARVCFLGASGGPGSGWRDATVYKLGVAYEAVPGLTLRGGVARLRQPIPASQTLLNILAPAVSEHHLTLGATWRLAERWELTVAYMRAFENGVAGNGSIPPGNPTAGVGGGEANLRMKQHALGVAVGWRM